MAVAAVAAAGVLFTPPAAAEADPNLKDTVVSERAKTQCQPLRYDPMVEHAAEIVNRSTDDFVSHRTKNVPADGPTDSLPILKDLGSSATAALSLQGAGHNSDKDAIHGVVLEGITPGVGKVLHKGVGVFKPLEELGAPPFGDCSLNTFGVSMIHNVEHGFSLATVVLATI
ncbi:hypothetical protein ACAG26_19085 [Mycobacterium sp. pUA109]|uniref:hypothetical protein n=1 Tax=Mycobacterium sp. pUA109 TaxID=3238982 RepID=UPI00351AC18D